MATFSKNGSPGISQSFDHAQHGLYRLLLQWIQIQNLKMAVAKEREQLLMLSDASLIDLGLTQFDANVEAFSRDLPAARLDEIKNRQC